MILHESFNVNEKGHLTIGGADAAELAQDYGTPAYIIDENAVRANCRAYRQAATEYFGADALPLYAAPRSFYQGRVDSTAYRCCHGTFRSSVFDLL